MPPVKTYIHQDEHGVLRVGDTRVMLDSVVAAFHAGHSAETIAQQYSALSLEEAYGAIAYYLANRTEVDLYLQKQQTVWEHWRERADTLESPAVRRLRSLAIQAGVHPQ